MDSIGYVLSEIVEIPGTISELREQTNRKQKITHLISGIIIILGILTFLYFEIKVTVDSYQKPSWSATEEVYTAIPFPSVILCPRQPELENPFKVLACFVGDSYVNITTNDTTQCAYLAVIATYNYSTIGFRNKSMSVRDVEKANNTKNDTLNVYCMVFSPNISTALYATSPNSILYLWLTVRQKNTLLSIGFFDQNTPFPNMNTMQVSGITTPGNVGYILLTRTQNMYLNGDISLSFQASMTTISNPTMLTELVLELSFSSLTVVSYEQYVAYDWIWLIGIISGILAFGRALYTLAIMIIDKIFFREKKEEGSKSEKEVLLSTNGLIQ